MARMDMDIGLWESGYEALRKQKLLDQRNSAIREFLNFVLHMFIGLRKMYQNTGFAQHVQQCN